MRKTKIHFKKILFLPIFLAVFGLGFFGFSSEAQAAVSDGLVAHWSMDAEDASGGVMRDISGNGYDANMHGTESVRGTSGEALYFNGTSDYLDFSSLNYDQISLSAWFNKDSIDTVSADAIFSAYRWSPDLSLREGYMLRFYQGSPSSLGGHIVTTDAGGQKNDQTSVFGFSQSYLNKWWHAVLTYDASSGEQKLYINGVLKSVNAKHPPGNKVVPYMLYPRSEIGYSKVNNGYFHGKIDDVKVWNRALTMDEVWAVYGEAPQIAINYPEDTFYNEVKVPITVISAVPAQMYYTTNGSEPNENAIPYTGPITIRGDTFLRVAAKYGDNKWTDVVEKRLTKYAGASSVQVNFDNLKEIPELFFGSNLQGHNRTCEKWSINGTGAWNPATKQPVQKFIDLAQAIDLKIFRYPDGGGANYHLWKATIGPVEERPDYQFGLDEFMQVMTVTGTEVVFVLPYYAADAEDASELVEYLNSPNDGKNPRGGIDWAAQRAANGHVEPYRVKYFELGNEVYQYSNLPAIQKYIQDYREYSRVMKEVDNSVELGAVLYPSFSHDWDRMILDPVSGVGNMVDFVSVHPYSPSYQINNPDVDIDRMFRIAYGGEADTLRQFQRIKDYSGRDIPLALTEFNGHFVQNTPYNFRHTFGNALNVAELMRVFLYAPSPILMTNYWQFANEYWGMIYNDITYDRLCPSGEASIMSNYTKRPNYLVYEMYRQHYGDKIADVSVNTATFNIEADFEVEETRNIPYLSASASVDNGKVYVMVFNKNLHEGIETQINLGDKFTYQDIAEVYTLTAPELFSTNEPDDPKDNVRIEHTQIGAADNFNYTFPKRTLTVIEMELADKCPTCVNTDVNEDGYINIKDIQVVIRVIITPPGDARADVNGDEQVNIKDIQEIIREIIKT